MTFQLDSLLSCWDEICEIQKNSGEDLTKAESAQRVQILEEDEENTWDVLDTDRNIYGNKPNLCVANIPVVIKDLTIRETQEALLFPLGIDFKYEYNSFRRRAIQECDQLFKRSAPRQVSQAIFIQTDIKTFYHSVDMVALGSFFKKKYPNQINIAKYIFELDKEPECNTLPIGWILSRFLSNIIIQHFHTILQENLKRNFENNTSKRLYAPAGAPLPDPKEFSRIQLESNISYVDDFIFILSLRDNVDLHIETIGRHLLEEAENLISQVLPGNRKLEFHKNGKKIKIFKIDKNRLPTLRTNFIFLDTADDYINEDVDVRMRISDLLLPVDNDLTLNVLFFLEWDELGNFGSSRLDTSFLNHIYGIVNHFSFPSNILFCQTMFFA